MTSEDRYPETPMFKGLQKPLEFMGMQGRYIYWAAGTIGAGFVGFIIGYFASGFLLGLILLLVTLAVGAVLIFTRQRKGLHSKKEDKGVFVYATRRKIL